MSFDPGDVVLNAYLDDRLDPAERAAFEVRIARDPELAARVERYREFRRALRGANEEPSPAFYTRARAEFEAHTRRGWRLLSWEAVGLAAAAVLAAVVFLPGLVRREELFAPVSERELSAPLRESLSDAAAPERQEAGGGNEVAPAPQVPAPGPRQEPALERQEGKQEASDLRDDDASRSKTADEFAPVPPAPAPVPRSEPPAAPPAAASRAEADSAAKAREETRERYGLAAGSAAQERIAAMAAHPYAGAVRFAVPLRGASLARGEVRTLESREAWSDARVAMPDSDLPPPIDGMALVLVGPRDRPFTCSYASVVPRRGLRVIELQPPVEGEAAAMEGCAIVVPLDGDPIAVVGPGEPR